MSDNIIEINKPVGVFGVILIGSLHKIKENSGKNIKYGLLKCPCGNTFMGRIPSVKSGNTKSCGCGINSKNEKNNLTGTKVRRCWAHIKTRCFNINNKNYKYYGARGITMYEPWVNSLKTFEQYVSRLPGYNIRGLSIDRIDNDGNYEPGNLRWATPTEQNNNRNI